MLGVPERLRHLAKQPIAELFGFPPDSNTDDAERYRRNRLCPFNNKVPNCTKDSVTDPLGVCTIFHGDDLAIICPIRLRQEWIIAEQAAAFFFPEGTQWTTLVEVRLKDRNGKSAGNIDFLLVSYDDQGKVLDYGALEVQVGHVPSNVRKQFKYCMEDPQGGVDLSWNNQDGWSGPDYFSSSSKGLAPEIIFRIGLLNALGGKTAVALDSGLFNALPSMTELPKEEANIAWLIYDLHRDKKTNRLILKKGRTVYTSFSASLRPTARSEAADLGGFVSDL